MKLGRTRVICLMLADALTMLGVWALCVMGYWAIGIGNYSPLTYLHLWPVVLLFLFINAVSRTYHGNLFYPAMPLAPPEEFRRLFLSAIFTHLSLAAVIGLTRSQTYSRLLVVICGVLTACGAQLVRDVVRSVLARFRWTRIPALLIGEGDVAARALKSFKTNAYLGFDVLRFCGDVRQIVSFARARDIRILFVCQDLRFWSAEMDEFVKCFHHIEYVPTVEAFPVADGRAISIEGLGGLEMVNQMQMGAMHVGKAVLDWTLATLIFIVTIPLFLIVPILIKLTSRGPVFYRAARLGKKGRPIRIWKFRSMYHDADSRLQSILQAHPDLQAEFDHDFKLKNDPRVTPLGKILRKTSIDELPQLLNVYTGEMALVGPRPIVEKEIPYYGKSYPIFSSVKPGITGLWQASGRSDTDYARRVALDVHYVLNWSPWMDLWIVFRTVSSVLRMKGSY